MIVGDRGSDVVENASVDAHSIAIANEIGRVTAAAAGVAANESVFVRANANATWTKMVSVCEDTMNEHASDSLIVTKKESVP